MTKKSKFIETVRLRSAELRQLGVSSIGLFGSVARGEDGVDSDLDVLVDFETGAKTFDHLYQLHELLTSEMECEVDLVTRQALSPIIGPKILDSVEYVEILA